MRIFQMHVSCPVSSSRCKAIGTQTVAFVMKEGYRDVCQLWHFHVLVLSWANSGKIASLQASGLIWKAKQTDMEILQKRLEKAVASCCEGANTSN